MPTVRLIRHAQASFGAPEYDRLSELGEQQALMLGARFGVGAPISRVVHGGLRRQHDTAKIGLHPYAATDLIHDQGWGEFDEQVLLDRYLPPDERPPRGRRTDPAWLSEAIDHVVACWVADESTTSHESFTAFRARIRRAFNRLWENAPPEGETLVVSSAGVIALLVAELHGVSLDRWGSLKRVLVNTGVTTIVRGRQGTHLITFNDHSHLEHDRDLITYR